MQQVRDLRRAHEHLVAADAALHMSSSAVSPAVRNLVGQADQVIAELYNAAEPAFMEITEALYKKSLHGRIEAAQAVDNPQLGPGTPKDEPEGD
ncbi:MAG TPA: hypothetical protein VGH29_00930 [Candidatus Binataceae bacterium]|jgi:hypothetical protein